MSDSIEVITLVSAGEDATIRIAAALAKHLRRGDLLALCGDLGAGKTCFVRGLAEGLGIPPAQVSSPTFVIRHDYEAPGAIPLVHIDAYRLGLGEGGRGGDDLESIGWDELLAAGDCIIAVEWPQRISAALHAERFDIALDQSGDNERTIRITLPPSRAGDSSAISRDMERSAAGQPARAKVCPSCGRAVVSGLQFAPFCSQRCRMADLNKWFSGRHVISRPIRDDDLSE